MEIISSQPGFRSISEPLSLRNPRVRAYLGFQQWEDLYKLTSRDRVRDYLRNLASGRVTFMNPGFWQRSYRVFTHRTVFKLIHGAEDQVEWLTGELNAEVLVLLRHPIAVALSRKQLPRLTAFVRSDYRRHFGSRELALAERVVEDGTPLEKGVLSWCFQASVPLRAQSSNASVLTYEQLVLEPEVVVPWLARRIDAPCPARMHAQVNIPSVTVDQSFEGSRKAVEDRAWDYMVGRWRESVDTKQEARAMAILEGFGLDAYRPGELVSRRYWLRGEGDSAESADRMRSR